MFSTMVWIKMSQIPFTKGPLVSQLKNAFSDMVWNQNSIKKYSLVCLIKKIQYSSVMLTSHWSQLTRIRCSSSVAASLPAVQSDIKCRDSCLCISKRLSSLLMNRALTRWMGTAPSASASICIFWPVASLPSSIMAFMSRPAPWNKKNEKCAKISWF